MNEAFDTFAYGDARDLPALGAEYNIVSGVVTDDQVGNLVNRLSSSTLGVPTLAAAFVYDRKGYLAADAIGGRKNPAYASDDDEILIEVRYRLSRNVDPDIYNEFRRMDVLVREDEHNAKIAALQADIDAEKEALAEKERRLEALRNS